MVSHLLPVTPADGAFRLWRRVDWPMTTVGQLLLIGKRIHVYNVGERLLYSVKACIVIDRGTKCFMPLKALAQGPIQ